jgi:hypothetical protein
LVRADQGAFGAVTRLSHSTKMAPFENWQGFKDIEPPLPDWEPNPDPSSIEIPGLETSASLNDQIDQMDQLITIKLQVVSSFERECPTV